MGTQNSLDYQFSCRDKTPYSHALIATRQAYYLSQFRGREFDVYRCRYCAAYHLGRINPVRRPRYVMTMEEIWRLMRGQ